MSEHTPHEHSIHEQKPVSFTVPFILASVVIFAIVMFLSLCDPKPHHGSDHKAGAEHTSSATTVQEASGQDASVPAESQTHQPMASPTGEHH